jgi:hypothetical protein
MPLVPLTVSM